jgi:hypothetical protein
MRVSPVHDNTCSIRIGMYREGQCTDGPKVCSFLSECDQHYDETTGDWDYGTKPKASPKKTHRTVNNSFSHKEKGFLTLIKQGRRETKQRRYNETP